MKTLDEFNLINGFLHSNGIQPSLEMFKDGIWSDLVILAQEEEKQYLKRLEEEEERKSHLSEEELALDESMRKEQEQLERERLLYNSCGYNPEKKR